MSEYTPTTEEVCEIYWQSGYKTTVEQFDRWLAKHDRAVKAEAWEEGFNAGEGEAYEHEARLQWSMPHTCAKNPYREETE